VLYPTEIPHGFAAQEDRHSKIFLTPVSGAMYSLGVFYGKEILVCF
jgi:hypothetical protein